MVALIGWSIVKQIMTGTLEMPGRCGWGYKKKEWLDCVADDLRIFSIGDGEGLRTPALDPGKWCEMVVTGSCTFMTA